MKGNDNKFLTGGFTMKSISRIYLSIISFISFVRAFVMAAGVVVLSATLMFNCATTKSADTSSRYVAESTTTSQEVKDYREIAKNAKELQELVGKAAELAIKSQQLYEIEEQARQEKEQARQEKEQALKAAEEARKKKDEAAKIEEQAAQREKQFLEEAKVLCVKMKEVLEHKEKECATNGCDNATRGKLEDAWNKYYSKCSK